MIPKRELDTMWRISKKYYFNNLLTQFQYMRIHTKYLTEEFRKEYNMEELIDKNGYVYREI